MRTFIAIRMAATPGIREALRDLASMQSALRLVLEEQLHVTVKFLGETNEAQVPDLLNTMEQVAQQLAGMQLVPNVVFKGLGAFPSIDKPNVVWIGFSDSGPLRQLANELSEACRTLGFEPEQRPYQPHLTLARVKSEPPERLANYLRSNLQTEYGSSPVRDMELFQSELRPNGPVYTAIGSVPLTLG